MASFSQAYELKLKELTFNSKPIINSLTMIADEMKSSHSENIVQLITQRIVSVHPSKRLPLIYLMDSILKNVKSVYISLFSKYVERLFVETYTESGDTIRGKLMRLLGTWRSCNLFPEPLLNALHSASVTAQSSAPTHSIRVLGSAVASGRHGRDRRSDRDKERERSRRQRTSQPYPQPHPNPLSQRSQQPYPNAPQPKRARTSYHGDGRAGSASAGALPSMTDVLRLLKKELVNRPDLQPMLDNIERNMKNKTGNMKEAIEALRRALQSPPSSNTTLQNSNPAPQPSQAPAHAHAPVSSTPSMSSSSSSSASAASAAPFAGVDFSALSQSLSSLNSILAPAPSPVHTITAPVPGVNSNSNRRSGGRAPVRSARVFDFDSKSLKIFDDWMVYSMHQGMPHQCRTCGLRRNTQAEMSAHLDFHFKHNRLKQDRAKSGQTISRQWYMAENEWGKFEVNDMFEVKKSDASQQISLHAILARRRLGQAKEEEKEEVSNVPADEDQEECPICMERFNTAWDDEEDQWMYQGVLRVEDKPTEDAETEEDASVSDDKKAQKQMIKDLKADANKTYDGQLLHQDCYKTLFTLTAERRMSLSRQRSNSGTLNGVDIGMGIGMLASPSPVAARSNPLAHALPMEPLPLNMDAEIASSSSSSSSSSPSSSLPETSPPVAESTAASAPAPTSTPTPTSIPASISTSATTTSTAATPSTTSPAATDASTHNNTESDDTEATSTTEATDAVVATDMDAAAPTSDTPAPAPAAAAMPALEN